MSSTRAVQIVVSAPDDVFGVRDIAQQGDRITARMSTGPHLGGPCGEPSVGALGVLTDNVLGYALMGSLPVGAWSISTEIWLDVINPLPRDNAEVIAEATVVASGSFSIGRVLDEAGRLVVECRQRGRRSIDGPRVDYAVPRVLPPSMPNGLGDLIGLRSEGDRHSLEITNELANPRQMLHGGVSLAASELAAARSRARSGSALPTTSVHIVHARGVPLGATVEFRTETVHAGRTLWLTDVLGTVNGQVCTATRVTAQR